ncbi:MAG: response regulator [Abitibacteriaceae bacterium]|nr:response regulator [Abditibacteriaceae bacterium]
MTILIADDNLGDRMLIQRAILECHPDARCPTVEDGEDLMDYLCQRGPYSAAQTAPLPDVILLDLNMPRKNGLEALSEIAADPTLSGIPVVMLTSSSAPQEILQAYELGASSFIIKPMSYDEMSETIKALCQYWTHTLSGSLKPRLV